MYLVDLLKPWKDPIQAEFTTGLKVVNCKKHMWCEYRNRRWQVGASAFADLDEANAKRRIVIVKMMHNGVRYQNPSLYRQLEVALQRLTPLTKDTTARCTGVVALPPQQHTQTTF